MNSLEIKSMRKDVADKIEAIVLSAKEASRDLTKEEQEDIDKFNAMIASFNKELEEIENKKNNTIHEEMNEYKKTHFVTGVMRDLYQGKSKTAIIPADSFKLDKDGNRIEVDINALEDKDQDVHDYVVETEVKGLLEPLYEDSLLAQLGVTWYRGYPMGDIRINKIDGGTAFWESELDDAKPSDFTFSNKMLHPYRLTTYVDVSNMLLAQDTQDVEARIRAMIIKAIEDKLEKSMFSTTAATLKNPGGILVGLTPSTISSFADIVNLEADLGEANVKNFQYVVGHKSRAALRNMAKSAKSTQLVMEGDAIDGRPAIVNNYAGSNNIIVADWSKLAVAAWGNIELQVDPYTQNLKDVTRFIVRGFFDWAFTYDEAIALGQTSNQ